MNSSVSQVRGWEEAGSNPEIVETEASALTEPAPLDRTKCLVKPFFGDMPIKGGAVLQKLLAPLTDAVAYVEKTLTSYCQISEQSQKTIQENMEQELDKITDPEKRKEFIKQKIITGQKYRNAATYCNGVAFVAGGVAGGVGGLCLWKIGGAIGLGAGVVGGGIVGAVIGYVAADYCADYLLRGLGISKEDPKYASTKFFIVCALGTVGGILGFVSCAVIGGVIGAFLGEALLVGGLAKGGAGLMHFLSSSTIGAYLDSVGKTYEDAAYELAKENGYEFDAVSPETWFSNMINMIAKMEKSHKGPYEDLTVHAPPLFGEDGMFVAAEANAAMQGGSVHGSAGKAMEQVCIVAKNIWENPKTAVSYYVSNFLLSKGKEEAGPQGYFFTPEQTERFVAVNKAYPKGSLFFYGAGVSLCAIAILSKFVLGVVGVAAGVVGGLTILSLGCIVAAIVDAVCVIGAGIEGMVVGGIGGYLLALERAAKDRDRYEQSLKRQSLNEKTIQQQMKEYDNSKTQNAIIAGSVVFMGLTGALLGFASFSVIKGGFGAFLFKTAIMGGSAKVGFWIAEHISNMLFNDLYCLGCALEKKGAAEKDLLLIQIKAEDTGVETG